MFSQLPAIVVQSNQTGCFLSLFLPLHMFQYLKLKATHWFGCGLWDTVDIVLLKIVNTLKCLTVCTTDLNFDLIGWFLLPLGTSSSFTSALLPPPLPVLPL